MKRWHDSCFLLETGTGQRKEEPMLWTILVILLVLWLLGLIGGYTFGGLLHILLVVAAIVLIIRLVQGRRVV